MLFSTVTFAVFMTVVFLAYWALPHRFRWAVLLAANAYFYFSFDVKYLLLLLFTIVLTYLVGIGMEKLTLNGKRKLLLAAGVLTSLFILFVFKYLNFTLDTVGAVLNALAIPMEHTTLKLLMPMGISFYTFQVVGYLIDVYRGKIKAERHFGKYAVFASFFPNISSGPIERAGHFLPQLHMEKKFDYDKVVYGSRQLLWGFIKKIVVADQLTKYVDMVFNNVSGYTGLCFAIATLLYTFQIYFDFSGYSDMAIGIAKMLGFDLLENFKSPYFASSIKEFWRRWHISLSAWFRDYVYISLGGNRVSKFRANINLMITFLVSGLWHGANWTFVLWGGIHGAAQIVEKGLQSVWNKHHTEAATSNKALAVLKKGLCTLITFCIVSYAWMFFRADTISDALYIARNMFADLSISNALAGMAMDTMSLVKVGGASGFILVFDYFNQKHDLLALVGRLPLIIRWGMYVGASIVILALCMHGGISQQFIYFNF